RLVCRPFELAVHLARGRENRDLADARGKAGLEAQVAVERARVRGRLGTVEPDPARAFEPDDRGPRRCDAVVVRLADLIQIFAFRQRQAESRFRIDIGWHVWSHGRWLSDLRNRR